jgi:uncharacterized protein (TIGR03118 family)
MRIARTSTFLKPIGVSSFTIALLAAFSNPQQSAAQVEHYTHKYLVSATSGVATFHDAELKNPWGLSRNSSNAWWVADANSGLSTLYDGNGVKQSLVVTIPGANAGPVYGTTSSPTGTVFNGGTGFDLTPGNPAFFLFVTLDGTVSGWNGGPSAVIKVNENGNSIYTGATIANVGPKYQLYVADIKQGKVQVFSSGFAPVAQSSTAFVDPEIPAGYAPFNVQNIGGNIYVAFAQQNSFKDFVNAGAGLGYVSVFSPSGVLLHRLAHGSYFNAPWGLVQASGDFGIYSHDILVGEFGSGEIQVFDPITGTEKGTLMNSGGANIVIPGLWALSFGNGAGAGSATVLYFTAENEEGTFGTLTPVENIAGNDN